MATDNTMQRVPQYIGQVGIVKEAPVHPCTWFKIKFDDGEVFTFRPSALVGVGDDYNPETGEGIVYRSNHSSKHSTPEQFAMKGEGKHVLTPVKIPNPKWLNELDGDLWVGASVRITTGRMKGHEGTVLRSGNGWVQVETVTFGEVAKRAHELELVSYDKSKITFTMPKMFGNSPSGASNGSAKRSLDVVDENGGVRTSSGRQVRPRTYSDAEDESALRGRAGNGRAHSYDASGNLLTGPSEQKQPSAPLIHPNIKEARNQYMQKYVKKMTEKLKHRPDLMYWTHMLKASHVLSGGLPDPALERELARDFMDSVCSTCLKERWPVAKYCWNEACPASPVYYKLTGCPPPALEPDASDSQTNILGAETTSAASIKTPVEGGKENVINASSKADRGDFVITIADDACPGDARFNVRDHDRAVKARMHVSSPIESAVVNTFSALPSVIMPSGGNDKPLTPEQPSDSAGVLVVETNNSSYKIPNSANARALLVQKLVREGLTDSDNRVCGDNWAVPEGADIDTQKSTSVSISKLSPTLISVSNSQESAFQDINRNGGNFPLPGLQLSGFPRAQPDRAPSLLPSIPPASATNSDFCLPVPNVILSDSFPGSKKDDNVASSNVLLLPSSISQAPASGAARISPYLAQGPGGFHFGSNSGPKSPSTRVN